MLNSTQLISFISKIVTVSTSILATAVITRLIKPEQAGIYFLVLSVGTGLSIALTSGLGAYGIKEIGRALVKTPLGVRNRTAEIISSFFVSATVQIILALVLAYCATKFAGLNLPIFLVLSAGLWSYLQAVQSFLSDILRGHNMLLSATFLGGGATGVIFLSALAAINLSGISDLDAVDVTLIYSLGTALAIIGFVPILARCVKGGIFDFGLKETGLNIKASWPICVNNILVFVLLQINLWISGLLLPMSDVALYGAATRAAGALLITNSVFYSLLPPQIVSLHGCADLTSLEGVLRRTATISTLLTAPAAIALIIFPQESLRLLFGAHYIGAHSILVPLALANFANVITGIRGYVLILTGHDRIQLMITVIGALFNVLLCVLGIHYFGVVGAAYGTGIAILIQCALETIALRRVVGVWSYVTVSRYQIAGGR